MSKSIPCSLLAFAVTSSLLFAQDGKGWSAKPGSGLSYDGGDAFGMKWSSQLQIHWIYTSIDNGGADNQTFTIRRARMALEGHAFSKDIEYKFQIDATDNGGSKGGPIKEGHVTWGFSKSEDSAIGFRVGQAKTQYGLEATGTSKGLWFVERSSAARAFSDAYSRGAWIVGDMMMKEKPVRFTLGAMNTDAAGGLTGSYVDQGEEANNSDNKLSYVLTANFDPLGDFFDGAQTTEGKRQGDWRTENKDLRGTVGVGVALGNGRDATTAADIQTVGLNLNTEWAVENFSVLGEYFSRSDDQKGANDKEKPTGWSVGAGYLLPKSGDSKIQWGFGLRVSQISPDNGNGATNVRYLQGGLGGATGDVTEVTAVVNAFYHSHACKTQFEYTYQDQSPDGGTSAKNGIFRIAFQLLF